MTISWESHYEHRLAVISSITVSVNSFYNQSLSLQKASHSHGQEILKRLRKQKVLYCVYVRFNSLNS